MANERTMADRVRQCFAADVSVVWRNGKWRANRVADSKILRGLTSLRGKLDSFGEAEYDAVLAELGEFGLCLETIGGPE